MLLCAFGTPRLMARSLTTLQTPALGHYSVTIAAYKGPQERERQHKSVPKLTRLLSEHKLPRSLISPCVPSLLQEASSKTITLKTRSFRFLTANLLQLPGSFLLCASISSHPTMFRRVIELLRNVQRPPSFSSYSH